MWMKVGDTAPKVIIDTNADLTSATARIRVSKLDGTPVLDKAGTITDAPNGIVEYQWVTGDTAVLVEGAYRIHAVVTFSGGLIETFPQRSYLELLVKRAIGVPA